LEKALPKEKNEWYFAPNDEKIGNYKCIKNSITGELSLEGKYGSIWLHNDTLCSAWIHNNNVINKYTNPKEKYKKGEERIIKFPLNDLDYWVKILGVKNNRKGMIERAKKVRS
jgi:hypothetical protein